MADPLELTSLEVDVIAAMRDDIEDFAQVASSIERLGTEVGRGDVKDALKRLVDRGLIVTYSFDEVQGWCIGPDDGEEAWYFPSRAGDAAYVAATGEQPIVEGPRDFLRL